MQNKAVFRITWVLSILLILSTGCGLVSQVDELQTNVDALSTQIESGKEILGTGEALATKIDESGVKRTLEAMGTKIAESGAKETVQAAATKFDEIGVEETVQAAATKFAESGAKETIQAKVTELPSSTGERPQDIPVLPEADKLIGNPDLVSYVSDLTLQEIVEYYEREMLLNGWQKIEGESEVVDYLATLNYAKDMRKATVIITKIPLVNRTSVLVTIQGN